MSRITAYKTENNTEESLAVKDKHRGMARENIKAVRSGKNEKLNFFIKPMLAQLHDGPFDNKNWLFEIKWDGYRAIAEVNNKTNRLYSRNGLSFLQLYPRIVKELSIFKEDAIFDGEIIVLNENNKPDFQKLQQYGDYNALPIVYYIFDCLSYQGKSLTHLPLIDRKQIARQIIPPSNVIKFSDHVLERGIEFFHQATAMDLEGIIAKRIHSLYTPGKRSSDWLKIKHHNTQEAIIAGYTAPRKSREYFGALILAIKEHGNLKYIGHTGTGFTSNILKEVYHKLQPLKQKTSPFYRKIPVNSTVTWVEPKLVCTIKFTEVTQDGILRHPVFLGLRIDKSADETTTIDLKPVKKIEKKSQATNPSEKNSKLLQEFNANGHTVALTNTNKIYWPEKKITKGDVIQYYNTIHHYILPYLKNRPQSLKRNPNGITDEGFYHKDAGDTAPKWVKTLKIKSESANKIIEYIICNNLATLAYLNNLGCIELNPWNSRISKLDNPDYLVLDIDPSEKNSFEDVINAALVIKEILDKAGASSYCKTSGATGLHIYVPLHAAYTYDQSRTFAEVIARLAVEQLPDTTTVERSLNKRNGKIYLDYLQNKKGQTLASVYSLRPKPDATISTPLLWKEVKSGLHPSQFTIRTIHKRLEQTGDLFTNVLKEKNNLHLCLKKIERLTLMI
jgi:bifunctional non-homologous end joining protein LigD